MMPSAAQPVAVDPMFARLTLARQLALRVGLEVEAFRNRSGIAELAVSAKGLQDFVTAADQLAEEVIKGELSRAFPDDGFVGEETGGSVGDLGFWLVDPIDGTANYIRGLRHWGVSIAYVSGGEVRIGCVFDATSGQVYSAVLGQGAFCGTRRISVSERADPAEALAILGYSRRTSFDDYQTLTRRLHELGFDFRRLGSAAVGLVRVADGIADLYYEAHLNSWDVLAGALIASEAGAVIGMPPLEQVLKEGGWVAAFGPAWKSTLSFLGGPRRTLAGVPSA